jgi:diguanylate cyclase (GGDEF)-like protein
MAADALARATERGDLAAEGWARLARGLYLMRYATSADALTELTAAGRCLRQVEDRAGEVLADIGIARCEWLQGAARTALERVMAVRDEGLLILPHAERAMMLNVIAGCHSTLGQSPEAFAYMYQALREASPARGHGFDVVLYNNLAHELSQLGEYVDALDYLDEGLRRAERLANSYLRGVLAANRIVCLAELGRGQEALADLRRLLESSDVARPGAISFAGLALAALRAGDFALGEELIARAQCTPEEGRLDEARAELRVARAELRAARGEIGEAAQDLEAALPLDGEGMSLRVRCLFFQALADLHQRRGDIARALAHLRTWQALHIARAQAASKARHQATSLQTELLRLQHERDDSEARRRATERARAELEAINSQLSQKVAEVQSLQVALKQQAVRDFLSGLFNRRHLNDVLPAMLALAQRGREPLAVAVIDLDHFKDVNDRYGHLAGDKLIAAFGELLNRRLRRSDVACRYGGEEFCVLMPRTSAKAARAKVDALRKMWVAMRFALDTGALGGSTFSAGVADSELAPGSVETLLKAADDTVLDAKRAGRNRVLVFDPQAALRGTRLADSRLENEHAP